MNRNHTIRLGLLIAAGIVLICLTKAALSEAAADQPIKAKLTASRHRAQPGELVEFKFKLVDSKGKSHPIPRSAPSAKSSLERPAPSARANPQLALYDSEGQAIAFYDFQFG